MNIVRHDQTSILSNAVEHGDTVYLAGVVAQKTAGESVTKQTEEILSIIDGHLAKAGTDKSKFLWCNVWLTDIREKEPMDAAWQAWVDPNNKPARATVESRLGTPDTRVEIMMIAAR
jgi:enamine deaminase RidA (YjgF/YER057c/UK114 family)